MTMKLLELAQALSDQPWADVGLCEGAIHSTSNEGGIVNQLTSILALRLDVIINTRKHNLLPSEVIEMVKNGVGRRSTIVGTTAESELRRYVSRIASMYREVGYHALEHAAHVTISLNKIVSLIVEHDREEYKISSRPSLDRFKSSSVSRLGARCDRNIYHLTKTFGIGRDALTQFALIFSALIHDVDHTGVPNRQLVKEGDELAVMYNDRSVAEQHSLYIAFATLLEPGFAELRHVIFPTNEEKRRFRKIVIDLVLSTDIASPERMQVGKSKWKEAFEVSHTEFEQNQPSSRNCTCGSRSRRHSIHHNPSDHSHIFRLGIKRAIDLNGSTIEMYSHSIEGEIKLKASSVLEQIIQTADVAHTMQGWGNFLKWNKRLYDEQWKAFMEGRGDDPSTGWYNNQISFYDFYILPLARRLLRSGVFGSFGYNFLQLAHENRSRWTLEGDVICDSLKETYKNKPIQTKGSTNGSNKSTVCI